VGQPVADLALQTRKLPSTDPRHRVQLDQHPLPALPALPAILPLLDGREEGRKIAAARDRRRQPGELRVQSVDLGEDVSAPRVVAVRSQLVDGELDRPLDDFRTGVDFRTFDAGHWANYETAPVVNAARPEML